MQYTKHNLPSAIKIEQAARLALYFTLLFQTIYNKNTMNIKSCLDVYNDVQYTKDNLAPAIKIQQAARLLCTKYKVV